MSTTPENTPPQWMKDAAEEIAAIIARHAPQPTAANDEYWRGYRARLDETTQEQPEPKNPTLWRYLQNAHEKQITFHSIGVSRMPDGGFHFYIHPQSVSGDTEDFLIWPDPFDWSDMPVNRKDSPAPDLEKFKAYLAKHVASKQEDKP